MTKKEVEIYRQFTGREKLPSEPFKEVFSVVGRRGGKSFISAIIACYLAVFKDWRPYLAPGETAWIMVIGADRAQAKNILGYIRGILQTSHIIRGEVGRNLVWEIELKKQVGIRVATCDYRTLRGYTVVAAICDEVAFWRSEGANPSQEILTAIRPALATIPGSLLLGISTPYSKTGPLYEAFKEKYGQDDEDVLVWKAPTKAMNPTVRDKVIDKALKADYAAGKAEWLAEWREDLETYISSEMIEAVVIPNRWELPKIEGVRYYAFADPSGGRVDSFTLAIAHKGKESKTIVLDRIEERKPPFNPQAMASEFSAIIKSYGLSEVYGDRYAGEWVVHAFRNGGVSFKSHDLNKNEIYLEFEPMMAQGAVELLDNQRLANQLRSLERRTRSGGRDLVDHPPGLHDDVANAAAGACVMAGRRSTTQIRVWYPSMESREREAFEKLQKKEPVKEGPPKIKVKMLTTKMAAPDGIHVERYSAGEIYELPISLCREFIKAGHAVLQDPADEEKIKEKVQPEKIEEKKPERQSKYLSKLLTDLLDGNTERTLIRLQESKKNGVKDGA
jgi:hypothetical protein